MNYYNDIDPFCCQWTRNLIEADLIPKGFVDERPIEGIRASDLDGYTQYHFFNGVAGWAHALDLAGWPRGRPVMSSSLPCQPFSAAGKGKAEKDHRHLWPAFFRLARQLHVGTIFGEQVASGAGRRWLAGVQTDCEQAGYAFGRAALNSACVGSPNIRARLYWVAHRPGGTVSVASLQGDGRRQGDAERDGGREGIPAEGDGLRPSDDSDVGGVAGGDVPGQRPGEGRVRDERDDAGRGGSTGGMAGRQCVGVRSGGRGPTPGAEERVQGADGQRQRIRTDAGPGSSPPGGMAGAGLSPARGHHCGGDSCQDEESPPQWSEVPDQPGRCGLPGVVQPENTSSARLQGYGKPEGEDRREGGVCREAGPVTQSGLFGNWDDYLYVYCRDNRVRRIGPQRGDEPLAARIPGHLGRGKSPLDELARNAKANRRGRLSGYGNSINPFVAALWIKCFLEAEADGFSSY